MSRLESTAVEVVANLAPWFAPLPTAWLVWDRTVLHLRWPWAVGLLAGATLELLGVGILATAIEHYNYNEGKRKTDPAAPLWISLVLAALYFVTAEGLTVVLDVWPMMATIAPALFPVLSVAAFVLLALRAGHQRRLAAIERDKAERKQARTERATKPQQVSTSTEQIAPVPLPFACVVCGSRFASQRALSGHGNKHRTRMDAGETTNDR